MLKYTDIARVMGLPIADTPLLQMIDEQSDTSSLPIPKGLTYFDFRKTGLEIITAGFARNISTVLLYGPGYCENYETFQGELPEQVVFGESRQYIELKLGLSKWQAFTDKPDVDDKLFLRLRYQRINHLLDLVLDREQSLFFVRMIAVPHPPRS